MTEPAPIGGATPGRLAYEEDVRRAPMYGDGVPRPRWRDLTAVVRATWERNPTPRRLNATGLAKQIVRVLAAARLDLSDEKALQAEMVRAFAAAMLPYQREVNLGDGDIVDFKIGDVAIEVKIKGSRHAIYRQCVRYCNHTEVGALVLATAVPMSLPETICAVPAFIVSLGEGWL